MTLLTQTMNSMGANPAQSSQIFVHQHARESIEAATKMVEGALQCDSSYPQLIDLFTSIGNPPTESGLHNQDYPAYLGSPSHVGAVKRIPLPAELTEQFAHMQSNCQMGLFPEIGRAWLTVDSDLFVWLYETGEDLAYFDGVTETVLSVALVRPKQGIFQSHIQYLLCLATAVEIVLLGVSFSKSGAVEEMHLLPEPLFSISSDSAHMMTMKGDSTGRIFMGARDGCLYELMYRADDGWFGRRCHKVNHSSSAFSVLIPTFLSYPFKEEDPLVQIEIDDSRHVLYTRSEKGTIQVFDLGPDGDQTSRVISVPIATTASMAASAASTVDASNFKPIVHIEPIQLRESLQVHLVAVTHTGVRLYFCTSSAQTPEARPSTLCLLHVRLPPGFSTHAPPQRVSSVHAALCRRGTTLLVARHSEDRDILWVLSSDAFPFRPRLMETHAMVALDGRAWCLTEVGGDAAPITLCTITTGAGVLVPSEPPAVVVQHMERPRKFVLISASGCHIVEKPRPVDQLRRLLFDCGGPKSDLVRAFFQFHGEAQACASCLILACSPSLTEGKIKEWAIQAICLYGGEPKRAFPAVPTTTQLGATAAAPFNPQGASIFASTPMHGQGAPLRQLDPVTPFSPITSPHSYVTQVTSPPWKTQGQQAPLMAQQLSTPAGPTATETVFSGRHDGCYLYFSRLVRPLWTLNLVTNLPNRRNTTQADVLVSGVSAEDLGEYISSLMAFKKFLEENLSLLCSPHGDGGMSTASRNVAQEAQLQEQLRKRANAEAVAHERTSLLQLQQLVSHTCEVLGLWRVLCDHQFRTVASCLAPDARERLRAGLTLRDLLLVDRSLTSALAGSLVKSYLEDNAATEAIASRLREVCPTLFRSEDATFARAHEMLLAARSTTSREERDRLLSDALSLCKQVGPMLQLPAVCNLLRSCGHPAGVVELCLSAASRLDPQDVALHYYRRGEPMEDERGRRAFAAREECYRLIREMLSEARGALQTGPCVPKDPGSPAPAQPPSDNVVLYDRLLMLALQSTDELFHVTLYGWLCDTQQADTLLEFRGPFLEAFLERRASVQSAPISSADLLWKYYERTGNRSAAARVLARLADRHGSDLTLARRLEYLARAVVCVTSSELRSASAAREGDFLHQLEEKMDVARLQLQVQEVILRRRDWPGMADVAATLDTELLDVTRLYADYADLYDLAECKLAIVRAAGYDDPILIETLWQGIVDREMRENASHSARRTALVQRLQTLVREYATSEKFLPLQFLVGLLEQKGCQLEMEPGWPVELFTQAGVGLGQLRDAYHNTYKAKDPIWAGRNLHLLQAIAELLEALVKNPSAAGGSPSERRRLTNRCLDDVTGYLIDLESIGGGDTSVAALVDRFKVLRAQLERLLAS
ncbi:nuclear pore complex protein Nup155-like [Ornithodoros turicata]|uniref:nuclear pore complex protein Nup155-like n=1 Tax=Ornithodoros turicata TaxID=34597 RepID=UPI00313A048C